MSNTQDSSNAPRKIIRPPDSVTAVQILALLNRLSLNAFQSKNRQMLIFQILNDTIQVISYQRATLWDLEGNQPTLLGVSGQAYFNKNSGIAEKWTLLVHDLKKKDSMQRLSEDSFEKQKELWNQVSTIQNACSIQWFPIYAKDKLKYGLWIERWSGKPWDSEELEVLEFLLKVYGASFEKFTSKGSAKLLSKRKALILFTLILCALFLIKVPLRVVAPAEVIPKNPVLITAPLNGIIAQMKAAPGEEVKKGEVLFVYDDRVTLEELKAAQKQVEILESQLHRAQTNALETLPTPNPFEFNSDSASSDIAVLDLQLEKEKIRLALAQSEAQKLYVKAPIDGVVMLDNPEEWRGHPVKIGERILMISDPETTKVRMWLPESDNITLDEKKPIKVFLNIDPDTSYQTHLIYISSYSEISAHGVPSFIAESEWDTQPPNIKLGLKGTAVLYGEDVTLFYWVVRRPWTAIRNFLGF
jgi:hypothetical protein